MESNWSLIVDCVRGLATAEARAAIEADPESSRRLELLSKLMRGRLEDAPELWVLRAKALLLAEPSTIPLLFGKLVFSAAGPQQGIRSAGVGSGFVKYQFEEMSLEISLPSNLAETFTIAGIVVGIDGQPMQVGTEDAWHDFCDEEGQFVLQINDGQRIVKLRNLMTGQIYQVELPDEL